MTDNLNIMNRQVNDLVLVIEEMGNLFLEASPDLPVLDTRNIVDPKVINSTNIIEKEGEQQFTSFVKDHLIGKEKSLFEPICRNIFPLFNNPNPRKVSSKKEEITTLNKSCQLFSKLYIACQVREGNLDNFFRHENQSYLLVILVSISIA